MNWGGWGLIVYVRDPDEYGTARKKCAHLGHQYYRCGNCARLVDVRGDRHHDVECKNCGWVVLVIREKEWKGY